MVVASSLLLFKLVLTTGLALWLTVVVLNNTIAYANGVAAIGGLMSMQLFDQEPAIKTPLLARRVKVVGWHRLIYTFVLTVEGVVGLLLWYAAIGFAGALMGSLDAAYAVVRANLAFSAFATMAFILTLGGSWFAYYIRQEGSQITHFVLIAVAIAAVIVVNAG